MTPLTTRRASRAIAVIVVLCALVACGGDDPSPAKDRAAPDSGAGLPVAQEKLDAGTSHSAMDGGADAFVVVPPPPAPDWDAAVPESVVGKTYAATSYRFLAPASVASAFNTLAGSPGSTRMLVNDFRAADGGVEVRYGAAAPAGDGGLAFQEALPIRTFRIAPSVGDANQLVSEKFTYTLRAFVPNTLGTSSFMLSIAAVDATWTARVSDDFSALQKGTLYGVVTRAEAEMRPLKLGLSCALVCGLTSSACAGAGVTTLAGMLDCTSTALDADVDGDGQLDGYNLAISFASERIEFAAAGQ